MRKPNLFIIGAPKCGTTSLAYWLSQHPDIYVPSVKEPNFFSTDIFVPKRMSAVQYIDLYSSAPLNCRWLCDASTRYLFSSVAVPEIMKFSPDARFIVLLRNPVDMVHSLWNHLSFLGVENIADFEQAWRMCDARRKGMGIPHLCRDPDSLLYDEIALFGDQIERLYRNVEKEKCLIIIFDDLASGPLNVLNTVFDFLNVEKKVPIRLEVKNKSMTKRFKWLGDLINYAANAKDKLGIRCGFGILNALSAYNRKEVSRPPIRPEFEKEMRNFFRHDVEKLSLLLGRDLTHWC